MYVQDYGAPVGWRLALRHPERIAAIVTQNGNAYVEGFVGDAMEPLFAYGRDRSEANAKRAARPHQHRRPEMAVHPWCFGPDRWSIPTPGSTRTPRSRAARSAVAVQLELFADYTTNVELYPACTSTSAPRRCRCWRCGAATTRSSGPTGALAFSRDLPNAEINLLDGGHFLLESRLDAVVALIRPFLERASGSGRGHRDGITWLSAREICRRRRRSAAAMATRPSFPAGGRS